MGEKPRRAEPVDAEYSPSSRTSQHTSIVTSSPTDEPHSDTDNIFGQRKFCNGMAPYQPKQRVQKAGSVSASATANNDGPDPGASSFAFSAYNLSNAGAQW